MVQTTILKPRAGSPKAARELLNSKPAPETILKRGSLEVSGRSEKNDTLQRIQVPQDKPPVDSGAEAKKKRNKEYYQKNKEKIKRRMRERSKTESFKKKARARSKLPHVVVARKLYHGEYYNQPEVKERIKEIKKRHRQKPETKEKDNARRRKTEQRPHNKRKNKERKKIRNRLPHVMEAHRIRQGERSKLPEVKKRNKAYQKAYFRDRPHVRGAQRVYKECKKKIVPLLDHPDHTVVETAILSLGARKHRPARMKLINLLKRKESCIKSAVVWALGEFGKHDTLKPLVAEAEKAAHTSDPVYLVEIIRAISKIDSAMANELKERYKR